MFGAGLAGEKSDADKAFGPGRVRAAAGQVQSANPKPRLRASARSGEVGKQRHDKKPNQQCANDPEVHALFFARIAGIVSQRRN